MSAIPPAERDAWSYGGDFHVEASGHNRHRRATVPELKAHFEGADDPKDRPAHWYEAQLIHYGLPPSKNKGTAKMRLFEAVSKNGLAVPSHILKVESDLKKEWAKKEREAKQALKKKAEPAPAATKATKRKAEQPPAVSSPNISINLSVSIGPNGTLQVNSAEPASKKAKTAADKAPKKTPAAKTPKAAAAPSKAKESTKSAPAKKPAASKPATKATKTETSSPAKAPRANAAARRGGHAAPASTRPQSMAATRTPPAKAPRKQTARRGGASATAQGRPSSTSKNVDENSQSNGGYTVHDDDDDDDDDPPPPYPGSPFEPHHPFHEYDEYDDYFSF